MSNLLKTVIVSLFVLITLSGCTTVSKEYESTAQVIPGTHVYYYTVVIDGCEYLVTRGYGGSKNLCHKGNCKYCIERESGGYYETSDSIE